MRKPEDMRGQDASLPVFQALRTLHSPSNSSRRALERVSMWLSKEQLCSCAAFCEEGGREDF